MPPECLATVLSEPIRQRCRLLRLEALDSQLNGVFDRLLEAHAPQDRAGVRAAQKAWLKGRDSNCRLVFRGSDRHAWLEYVAASLERAECVIPLTAERIQALDSDLARVRSSRPAGVPPSISIREEATGRPADYVARSQNGHRTGRRYFEVAIEQGNIAAPLEASVIARVAAGTSSADTSFQIRPKDTVVEFGPGSSVQIAGGNLGDIRLPRIVLGIAADLDSGRVYFHRDGQWLNGPPGKEESARVRRGGVFSAEVETSSPLKTLVDNGIVSVNFGGRPFEVGPPSGYSGFDSLASRASSLTLTDRVSIFGPEESVAGWDQVHWIQQYWRWTRGFPAGGTPSDDMTGERCTAEQQGPVWFLTGSHGSGTVARTCDVPKGVIILVPLVNSLAQSDRPGAATCGNLVQALRRFSENVSDLRFSADGTALPAPDAYFRQTGCFDLRDVSRGVSGSAAGSGYWVILHPLPEGVYEIRFGGRFRKPDFEQDIRYTLRVR